MEQEEVLAKLSAEGVDARPCDCRIRLKEWLGIPPSRGVLVIDQWDGQFRPVLIPDDVLADFATSVVTPTR